MPATLSRSLLLGALLGATACTSTTLSPRIGTNPPGGVTVYINGKEVGGGTTRSRDIDFANTTRCWIQAVRRGHPPKIETYTRSQVEEKIRRDEMIVLDWGN